MTHALALHTCRHDKAIIHLAEREQATDTVRDMMALLQQAGFV